MTKPFIHLNIHSEFSIVDGLCSIDDLVGQAKAQGMPAIGLTDHTNLFALVKFYEAALEAGIKPIIGSEVWLAPDDAIPVPTSCILLCQNRQGYYHLTELISWAYTHGQDHQSLYIKREWLQDRSDGLIALSGGLSGDIAYALLQGYPQKAEQCIQFWQNCFNDRFYIELTRVGHPHEERYIQQVLSHAQHQGVPVVATNAVRFLQQDDFEAHEARVCINQGYVLEDPKRPRPYTESQYLRSTHEMTDLFSDVPSAIDNSYQIAKRCNLTLNLGEHFLPEFPTPNNMPISDYLKQQTYDGLRVRLKQLFGDDVETDEERLNPYWERVDKELEVINSMGFPGYFLIVADFIRWSKENGIPVGPGRGSGAGSLVAFALKITDLDPLRYDLLFERFLNPERVSMPDFDVDFCMEGRDQVIDYVAHQYGRDSVSQIITFGTMAAKAVVRDVGRVLHHPYGYVDKIAKLIPFEIGMTLDKALEEPALKKRYDEEEEVRTLIDLGRKLEGVTRNAGKHAGGVVIAPGRLIDYTPLYCESGTDSYVTQLDKDDVEAIGLVKFDFLGLRTLTIIKWALANINRQRSADNLLSSDDIPVDDQATLDMLKTCKTTAVFQLESRGMKDLIRRLQPDSFEDIIALVALFRPGPLQSGMVDDFVERKHGRVSVQYPHPWLEEVLKPTYGVILYQEQVMQIAQVLANYSLGAADILRRAMGKKKAEAMAKQREIFMEGALANGIDEAKAREIFDLMEKFAGYGFNKSHSAAYALIAYQTAWLKTHYPAEFMAAVLSSDMDNTDKVVDFIEECRQMELAIKPPDINMSEYPFTVRHDGSIVYGLGAIKGAGESALTAIIEERQNQGPYESLFDFCVRVDLRKVSKRVIEALVKAGALDSLVEHRAGIMGVLDELVQAAEQAKEASSSLQADLFAGEQASSIAHYEPDLTGIAYWSEQERLRYEKHVLGLYLTGHPIQAYQDVLQKMATVKPQHLNALSGQVCWVAGVVIQKRAFKTKKGQPMMVVTLADEISQCDVTLFSEVLHNAQHIIELEQIVCVEGEISDDQYTGGQRVLAKQVLTLDQMRYYKAKLVHITLEESNCTPDLVKQLAAVLTQYGEGHCQVTLHYSHAEAYVDMPLGRSWYVQPKQSLMDELQTLLAKSVEIDYLRD